ARQRFELVKNIKGKLKTKPLRRVWIPKPGRDEKSGNGNTHNPR
ncbi:MAG: RNA-directed DNA polymerase, partial [Limnospira sp. Paracas R14]|nr:RNA-directed DNA polymerase [Limnospira sp. Paracas R14]